MDFSLSDEKNLFECVNTRADNTDFLTLNASDLPNVQNFSVSPEIKEVGEKEDMMLSVQNKVESLGTSTSDASKTEPGASGSEASSLSNSVNVKQNESLNKKSNSKRFECYECLKTFPSFPEVVTHLKLIHNACASRDCSKISNFKLHSPSCVNRGLGCSICNQTFRDKHLLLVHFYDHIGAAFYACEECREGFQLRRDLQKHFFQTHNKFLSIPVTPSQSKTLYQKCNHCSKYFKLFAEFEEHVSSCKPSAYACYFCSIGFASSSALEDHKLAEHKNDQVLKGNVALKEGKRYFCGICYIGFSKGSILKEHVLTHEANISHICDVCHRKFPCDNDLQEHYLEHIEEHYILQEVISQYSCSTCQRTFKTQKELKDHLQLKSCKNNSRTDLKRLQAARAALCSSYTEQLGKKNIGEAVMDMSPDFSSIPVYVLKIGEDLLNCDDSECVIVMDLTSLFVLQRGMCASENRMPDVKNSEVYTETEVVDASLLENHMLQILCPASINGFNEPENVSNFQDAVEYTVDSTSSHLEAIIFDLSEVSSASLKNESDKMQFESIPVNNKNKNQLESEKYEFLVYDSSKDALLGESRGSSIKAALETHKLSEAKECVKDLGAEELLESEDGLGISGLYICNICKQVFSSKTSLCLHVKGSHTGFDCYHCGDSFHSDEELKKHEKNLHPSSFQCDLCDLSYPKEHLLKKHKCSAHDGQIFYCNICNKSYALKNEFEVHMMLHKGETPPTQCEECGKIYASVSNYQRHKATHESKAKKYICTICDKAFAEHSSLKIHLGSHMRKAPYSYECPKCKMYFPPKVLAKHVESHVDIVS